MNLLAIVCLNAKASLAKWLSVRLRTKWLWVQITLFSLKIPDVSGLVKTRALNMILAENQKEHVLPNLFHYVLLSCIT